MEQNVIAEDGYVGRLMYSRAVDGGQVEDTKAIRDGKIKSRVIY